MVILWLKITINMLTRGNIIFALTFLVVFVAAMIWSFKKDSKINSQHYKNAYKVLICMILAFLALFLFIKFRKNL
jgi:hypothetical membrane protein